MKEEHEAEIESMTAYIAFGEVFFVFITPIYLYGLKAGLLITSGLTSLLHIVALLKKQNRALGLKGRQ